MSLLETMGSSTRNNMYQKEMKNVANTGDVQKSRATMKIVYIPKYELKESNKKKLILLMKQMKKLSSPKLKTK